MSQFVSWCDKIERQRKDMEKEKLLLLGTGGHAHSVVDSIEQSGIYQIVGFLDLPERVGALYQGYKVLGTDDLLDEFFLKGVRSAFVTVGYMGQGNVRNELYHRLTRIGYQLPVITDKTAAIAKNVKIGRGSFVGKNAVVNACAQIGDMCIINSAAVVEHDCRIGDFSHIAVGAVVCGGSVLGRQTFIGANATLIQNVSVGDNVVIGAGTLITKDIADNLIKYAAVEKRRDILKKG